MSVMLACGGRIEESAIGSDSGPIVELTSPGGAPATGSGGIGQHSGGTAAQGGAGGTVYAAIVRCPGGRQVAVSGPACGDGRLDTGEKCDDGNVTSGDGCSSRCFIELGWICPTAARECLPCGNCQLDVGETCDDGNAVSGDGCSARCQVEDGFRCDIAPYQCVSKGTCGDGILNVNGEICDDANSVGGDGCSADCAVVEPGYLCTKPGERCKWVITFRPHCGDGVVQWQEGETCDDGINDGRYRGCSADCAVPRCGDAQVQPEYGEDCDDGVNDGSYLGCAWDCTYTPRAAPDGCTRLAVFCGDAVVQSTETCDDGINDGLGGRCSPSCTNTREGYCGDGVVNSAFEECDDGNWDSCDGCSSSCKVESLIQ